MPYIPIKEEAYKPLAGYNKSEAPVHVLAMEKVLYTMDGLTVPAIGLRGDTVEA